MSGLDMWHFRRPVPEAREASPPGSARSGASGIKLKYRHPELDLSGPPGFYFTSFWIRAAISWRTRWLRVMTSTVSSPAMVPMISDQPA